MFTFLKKCALHIYLPQQSKAHYAFIGLDYICLFWYNESSVESAPFNSLCNKLLEDSSIHLPVKVISAYPYLFKLWLLRLVLNKTNTTFYITIPSKKLFYTILKHLLKKNNKFKSFKVSGHQQFNCNPL